MRRYAQHTKSRPGMHKKRPGGGRVKVRTPKPLLKGKLLPPVAREQDPEEALELLAFEEDADD